MSIEVACPACGGSIQIEAVSEVVACPLCQVHLQVDSETSQPVLVTEEEEPETEPADESEPETTAAAPESDSTESVAEGKEESPFAFLPGGNQKKPSEPRPAAKFSFLPGGADETADSAPENAAEETESTEEPVSPPEATAAADTEQSDEQAAQTGETAAASPFSFLPGGNQSADPSEADEEPTGKFGFLPGGSEEVNDSAPENTVEETEPTEETVTTPEEAATTAADTEQPDEQAVQADETAAASPFSFLPGGNQSADPSEADEESKDTTLENSAEGADSTEETESTPEETVEAATEADTAAAAETRETENDAMETAEEATAEASDTETATESAASEDDAETSSAETPAAEESAAAETTADEPVSEDSTPAETTETASTATASEPETAPAPQQNYRRGKVVSRRLFTLTLTYAIAATAMVAMLLYAKYQGDPHQLESLPDLKPPIKNDEIALQLVPEDAELPPGHTLQLGGPGRRFGNVLVTPLRVTRGPLEFEHYTGDTARTREHSGDVLKLHLKFENVSDDQTFEPLDQKLLLTRVGGKTPEAPLRANNFICRVDQKHPGGKHVLVYDMPPSWEWNLKGQNINLETTPQKLAPGESFETYVATNEEGIDSLTGDLVWRLQIRKGYNPSSHRGVTTLIDVVFNSEEIQKEVPAESKAAQSTS